ncbi:MAG: hypothetical protein R2798_02545 [Chitinophagales bacterium]|nr:hypothetical protein [Bacteroidota bacterium]MCB9042208.1 hypothetical protein [Chitinophagales bacterium]
MYLGFFLFLFVASCKVPQNSPQKNYSSVESSSPKLYFPDTTCTLLEWILAIEQRAELPIAAATWQNLAQWQTLCSQTHTPERLEDFLEQTDSLIQKFRLQQTSYHNTLSMGLSYRMFDCDIQSFLYISRAEQFSSYEIQAMLAPNHMFLACTDTLKKDTIFWETTIGKKENLAFYYQKYQLSQQRAQNGFIFIPLNNKSLVAVAYYNIAKEYFDSSLWGKCVHYLYQSLAYNAQWVAPYELLGQCFLQLNLPENACIAYAQAWELRPDWTNLQAQYAAALRANGCPYEAGILSYDN